MTKINSEDVERVLQEFVNLLEGNVRRAQSAARQSTSEVESAKHNAEVWVNNDIRSVALGMLHKVRDFAQAEIDLEQEERETSERIDAINKAAKEVKVKK